MAEMAANEASLQCKVHALQAEKEEAQDVIAMRDTEIAELKQTNGQLDSWNWEWHRQHESLVATLPDAGQWKAQRRAEQSFRQPCRPCRRTRGSRWMLCRRRSKPGKRPSGSLHLGAFPTPE